MSKRIPNAGVQLNATTLWLSGGFNKADGILDSSDFIQLDSAIANPGPKLPYAVSTHCVVKNSQTKVYLIGGYGTSFLNKVLIFNPMNGFTHIEGPSLITKRSGHSCSLMSNGQHSKIVVAGGFYGGYLSSVEIFDPTANKWTPGKKITIF